MQDVKLAGIDVGNDSAKIYLKEKNFEGKYKLEIMNVVAPGYNRRILGVEQGHLSNLLDVNIEIDGKDIGRYFVGGLAYKDNRGDILEKNKKDVKAKNQDTIILLVTSAAYGLYDPNNTIKSENVGIGTLLPTEEYWNENEDLLKDYADQLKHKYKVKFNSPAFKKAEIELNIVDYDIQPESAAGHLVSIYDLEEPGAEDKKENIGENKEQELVENTVHLGIFIGSVTTEVSVYEHGEFNPKGFFGIDLGTSEPLDKIIADLGIEMTRHQLDYFIRSKKKLVVNVNGKTEDLTDKLNKCKETRFAYFTKLLVNRINQKLSLNGINTDLVTQVNLGGGGGITSLDSFQKEFRVGNIKLVKDARFANSLGALHSIMQKLSESEAAADEVLG